ncbi:sugar ABC transporter substrate-binding protein [Lactiplantibacillus plantarum]|uniref:sugar ABC transporter substrate-binding protein n=1 Tax=Lactiplantibacillus plantarum TaxID=1590 RepID=UPI0007B5586F|nr:extracellular solute-binding protein [Lactiplantibacillus plantarum]KZT81657.1 Maltose/maltodextrin ABC transporter substratebinding periplasmic protein MalE [Lactiplantibacillus plantarum]KZT88954.1 Maltose/maltodextrin ABC transporter substratebinding periplasmic protein MalE [Lactiplantibacillus plantarum]KZU38985.1 Maltose/maltodextrin ABC transporter substratebinding periplasmic protein MalE [Lactiplantibacillus plantarum]KZU48645.1 Maltose/maltodextrin ABC transporter substratebinding 
MKSWIKGIGVSAALMVSVGLLAACGNQSSSSKQTDFKGQTLKVGIWYGSDQERAGINKVIKGFEKKTGAKVTTKVYTNFNTQIQADLSGHKAPDAFYMDSSMYPWFEKQGVLEKLDAKQMQSAKFYPNLINAFKTKGNLYGVPKDNSTLGMLVNKKMLEKTGVRISSIPSSYDGLIKWLPGFQAKLDKAYGKNKVKAMTYDQDMARNYTIMKTDGGKPIKTNGDSNLSSAKVLENMKLYQRLVATGAVATAKDLGSGDNGTAFGTGKVAMTEEGNWTYEVQNQQYKTDYSVLPMPSYKGARRGMIFTVGWGEYASSKVKPLASAWIAYATSKEGQSKWAKAVGTMPSRPDVAKALKLSDNDAMKTWLAATKYSTVWQDGTTVTTVNTSYQNFVAKALDGKTTMKSAMTSADKQANAAISKAN